jgi:hypothetical protein
MRIPARGVGDLKAISIPVGSTVRAPDSGSGLILIYHGHKDWIDFFCRNIEQPQWATLRFHRRNDRTVTAVRPPE